MKFTPAIFGYMLRNHTQRRNLMILVRLLVVLFALITTYSIIFHALMTREGQEFSWATGFYWTLTVMSTLGFGDITFHSDMGRIFSMFVLASGMIFLLVLLPFTFIEFFYAPWMEAQQAAATPRKLPEDTTGHVVLTHWDNVTANLIKKLPAYGYDYVVIIPTLEEARELTELGIRVVLGDLDDPPTYKAVCLENAAILAATGSDTSNTNAAFTARDIAPDVRIVSTASRESAKEVLQLSGVDQVIHLPEMMGQSLARRCSSGQHVANLLGQFDELAIAEAPVNRTELVGKTLAESQLRALTGVGAIGVWERGTFEPALAHTRMTENTVLVLAGTTQHISAFNQLFSRPISSAPIVIIGGGRVGRAAGRSLAARGLDYRIIERLSERIRDPEKYILGDAFKRGTLEEAGILKAHAVILTTHDDDTNVYLAIFIRRIRSDIQLIGRANLERNISNLHRAGADFVMSYAGMGAGAILNVLRGNRLLMVAEGLGLIKVMLPDEFIGKSLLESNVRNDTGCSIVGVRRKDFTVVNPQPDSVFQAGDELVIIATVESENKFLEKYPPKYKTALARSDVSSNS
jgi:Trk K+ transport system NAD-binding subunit